MSDDPASDPTAAPDRLRYRAAAAETLLWHDCGGEFAAFHRPSGKTHFLNLPSAQLLRSVLTEPRTAAAAADRLAAEAGGVADAGYRGEIQAVLERLEQLGLVEREAP